MAEPAAVPPAVGHEAAGTVGVRCRLVRPVGRRRVRQLPHADQRSVRERVLQEHPRERRDDRQLLHDLRRYVVGLARRSRQGLQLLRLRRADRRVAAADQQGRRVQAARVLRQRGGAAGEDRLRHRPGAVQQRHPRGSTGQPGHQDPVRRAAAQRRDLHLGRHHDHQTVHSGRYVPGAADRPYPAQRPRLEAVRRALHHGRVEAGLLHVRDPDQRHDRWTGHRGPVRTQRAERRDRAAVLEQADRYRPVRYGDLDVGRDKGRPAAGLQPHQRNPDPPPDLRRRYRAPAGADPRLGQRRRRVLALRHGIRPGTHPWWVPPAHRDRVRVEAGVDG